MSVKARIKESYDGSKEVEIYQDSILSDEARFASQLIERWGLVAAMPDGEDSAGRQKMRLPTPAELVFRAMTMAETFFIHAKERGHVITVPDLNAINEEFDEKLTERREARRS